MSVNNQEIQLQCKALTRKGDPCKNLAFADTDYCYRHQSLASTETTDITVTEMETETFTEFDVEGEISEQTLREQLLQQFFQQLNNLAERIQAITPNYVPPIFSSKRLQELFKKGAKEVSSRLPDGMLEQLQNALGEDLFDPDTWRGLWYVFNYTIDYQRDLIKRRFTGEYHTDEWGLDWEFVEAVRPFFEFLYRIYWRVEVTGYENVPAEGRGLLVANHSGVLPWDGAMVTTALYLDHPDQRLVRSLYGLWFPQLPFVSTLLERTGQVLATSENGIRLLEQDELVVVYPEGYKGVGKLFKDRYQLARFGRGGFVKMALHTQSPIIPVSVVGAEEIYVPLRKSTVLSKLTGFPYFPISLRFPWLGLLGLIPLPTKWYIDFGPPVAMDNYAPKAEHNLSLVTDISDQVRDTVQEMIKVRLAQRKSVFFG